MNQTKELSRIADLAASALRGLRAVAANLRQRSGAAAIEFALVTPLLAILVGGVVEIGMASYQAMQVQSATEAGILYATEHGASNITAIGQAVVNATGTAGITASPVPLAFCGCPSVAGVVSQNSNCTTVCSDGTPPGQYVTVSAALAHHTIMSFLNLPLPATLTASSTVRLQ
jgi:Flp pilus assembly protein TadG